MTKPYLSELEKQLKVVKEKLDEIHLPVGPLAKPLSPETEERRKMLLRRKREVEDAIVNWKP